MPDECGAAPSTMLLGFVPEDIGAGLGRGMAEGLKALRDTLALARP